MSGTRVMLNIMKITIAVIGLLILAPRADAQDSLDIEVAYVVPGYNHVAIPDDTRQYRHSVFVDRRH
jgi:hypothetical protein